MRALRAAALEAGAQILDHHPAIELLRDAEGRIAGARGHALRHKQDWEIRSKTTILATGGNAFRSGLIGSHTNTGDGQLMAAEAGVALSGMEFGPSWSISPAWASTRTLPYTGAIYYDAGGRELDIPPIYAGHAHNRALGHAMLDEPVLADLSQAPQALRPILRRIQPFTPAPFERRGVNIFRDRFPVKLFGEGTIRGTGGLDLADAECRTSAPGLFAIGDAATREWVAGANSGGGAVNSAWALSSGRIAGAAAAHESLARRDGAPAPARGIGRVGITPEQAERAIDSTAIYREVDHQIHGYAHVFSRDEASYATSADELAGLWRELANHGRAQGASLVGLRETAALVAGARCTLAAAQARKESRGLHHRADFPEANASLAHRQRVSGLDAIRTHAQQAEFA